MLAKKVRPENFLEAEINIGVYQDFLRAIPDKRDVQQSAIRILKATSFIAGLAKHTFNNKRIALDRNEVYNPLLQIYESLGWIGLSLKGDQFSYAGFELRESDESFGYVYETNPSIFKILDLALVLSGQAGAIVDLLTPGNVERCTDNPHFYDQLVRIWTYTKYITYHHRIELSGILKDSLMPYYQYNTAGFDQISKLICEKLES